MDFSQVKELITIMNGSPFTEFELKLDNAEIKMSKNTETKTVAPSAPAVSTVSEAVEIKKEEVSEVKKGDIITSPIVGTFYESQSPQSPPLVKVGDRVKAGDILCIIEAMKVMNEITAKADGEIAEIMVANEQMVEFNQPLFRII